MVSSVSVGGDYSEGFCNRFSDDSDGGQLVLLHIHGAVRSSVDSRSSALSVGVEVINVADLAIISSSICQETVADFIRFSGARDNTVYILKSVVVFTKSTLGQVVIVGAESAVAEITSVVRVADSIFDQNSFSAHEANCRINGINFYTVLEGDLLTSSQSIDVVSMLTEFAGSGGLVFETILNQICGLFAQTESVHESIVAHSALGTNAGCTSLVVGRTSYEGSH